MKREIKIVGLAAGMVMAGAVGASAAVIDFGGSADNGNGLVQRTPNSSPLIDEFSFLGEAPFYAYQDLTVGREFSISLENYQPNFSGAAQSFFTIQNLDTLAYVTTDGTCDSDLAAIDEASCNAVNGDEGSAGNPPPLSFSGLDAGEYRVGFYENGEPEGVQADFRVSAVPLPAAGWLLVAGLGGLAAVRRRKKAA